MAKQTTIDESLASAQGAGANDQNTEGHDLSQIVSELIQAKDPEWVEQLLASYDALVASNAEVVESNKSVIESNKSVIESISEFKEAAVKFLASGKSGVVEPVIESDFDKSADYEVAEGKSFRDPKDFTKEYQEGEDVSHLPIETLERLHANGLITEA